MRVLLIAATLALVSPAVATACNMAYASCRNNDSQTDRNSPDREQKAEPEPKPQIGWPGMDITVNDEGRWILHDDRLNGGVGLVVSYDKQGHVYVVDRRYTRVKLGDPSKKSADKSPGAASRRALTARMAPASEALQDAASVTPDGVESERDQAAGTKSDNENSAANSTASNSESTAGEAGESNSSPAEGSSDTASSSDGATGDNAGSPTSQE